MPKSEREIVKQEEVFVYEIFDLSDGRRVGVSADMSCGKPVLTVTELEPADLAVAKSVCEIVAEIDRRIAEADQEMSGHMRRGYNFSAIHEQGKRDALISIRDWIQSDAKEGNDDDR